jgi:hypothetical protein
MLRQWRSNLHRVVNERDVKQYQKAKPAPRALLQSLKVFKKRDLCRRFLWIFILYIEQRFLRRMGSLSPSAPNSMSPVLEIFRVSRLHYSQVSSIKKLEAWCLIYTINNDRSRRN